MIHVIHFKLITYLTPKKFLTCTKIKMIYLLTYQSFKVIFIKALSVNMFNRFCYIQDENELNIIPVIKDCCNGNVIELCRAVKNLNYLINLLMFYTVIH